MALAGCGKNLEYSKLKTAPQNVIGQNLDGYYTDLNGSVIDFKTLEDSTTVLIFAQDTCQICSEEAFHLSDYVNLKGLPSHFKLRHMLVSSVIEDAVDWTADHKITWPVGVVEADLFRNYCPAQQVPCVIIFKPNLGITFQHTGVVSVDNLIKETGGWVK